MPLFAALALALLGVGADFTFVPPAGWIETEPDLSSLEENGVTPDVARLARQPDYAMFAVAPTSINTECPATMAASLIGRPMHVTNRFLASLARGMEASVTEAGAEVQVAPEGILEKDGSNIGVLKSHLTLGGCTYEQVSYILPGTHSTAQVVFSAVPEEFAALRPSFEGAALQTRGLADDVVLPRLVAGLRLDNTGDRDYALGFLIALGAGAAVAAWGIRRAMR